MVRSRYTTGMNGPSEVSHLPETGASVPSAGFQHPHLPWPACPSCRPGPCLRSGPRTQQNRRSRPRLRVDQSLLTQPLASSTQLNRLRATPTEKTNVVLCYRLASHHIMTLALMRPASRCSGTMSRPLAGVVGGSQIPVRTVACGESITNCRARLRDVRHCADDRQHCAEDPCRADDRQERSHA